MLPSTAQAQPDFAKKRFWPLVGVIVGPIVLSVPLVYFFITMVSLQRELAGGLADPRHTVEQARLMSFSAVAVCILVPLGGAAFVFSVIRLARLRRQTPPKLPPAIPPPPGEPT